MEIASLKIPQSLVTDISSNDVGHHIVDVEPQHSNQGDGKMKCEVTEEELGGVLEVIASTGKFWHEWDTLKGLLSTRLKQVLAEYPESQMDQDQQSSSLGETYADLRRRLDEALFNFMEGPPFTLQRLCEILLTARSIYPKLPKLALALEKNLLVTSTLTISMDPYPSSTIPTTVEPDKVSVEPVFHSSLQNGVESVVKDEDEVMADAEEVAVDNKIEDKEIAENAEETINVPVAEASSDQNIESEPSGESTPSTTEPLDTSI